MPRKHGFFNYECLFPIFFFFNRGGGKGWVGWGLGCGAWQDRKTPTKKKPIQTKTVSLSQHATKRWNRRRESILGKPDTIHFSLNTAVDVPTNNTRSCSDVTRRDGVWCLWPRPLQIYRLMSPRSCSSWWLLEDRSHVLGQWLTLIFYPLRYRVLISVSVSGFCGRCFSFFISFFLSFFLSFFSFFFSFLFFFFFFFSLLMPAFQRLSHNYFICLCNASMNVCLRFPFKITAKNIYSLGWGRNAC